MQPAAAELSILSSFVYFASICRKEGVESIDRSPNVKQIINIIIIIILV